MNPPAVSALSARAERADRLISAVLRRAAAGGPDLERLDALVDATAAELAVESVQVSMMSDRQVGLSGCGPVLSSTDRGAESAFEDTVCANVLRTEAPIVIPDTAADARVSTLPAVQAGDVGAYLGVPLRSGGEIVGVLCAFQLAPRRWTADEQATLARYADEVQAELERLAEDRAPVD